MKSATSPGGSSKKLYEFARRIVKPKSSFNPLLKDANGFDSLDETMQKFMD